MEGFWLVSYVALWGLVALLCVMVVALARQIGTLHLRLGPRGALEIDDEGPALGQLAPTFEARDVEGAPVMIGGPGRAQMLLFVSPGCHICEQVLPSLDAVARMGRLEPVVVTDLDPDETASAYRSRHLPATLVPGMHVAIAYEVPGTPYVVLIDADGIVKAKGTVNNLEQMEGLVETFARRNRGLEAAV